MTTRETYLESLARRSRCIQCKTQPRVAWLPVLPLQDVPGYVNTSHPHEFRLRCNCYPQAPVLEKLGSVVKERIGEIVAQQGTQTLATKEGALRLAQEVKQYLAPKATDAEVAVFLRFCQGLDLNPFIKEVYLVKYDDRAPAAIVVGIQAYLKWAARNPAWGGFESGIVVLKDGKASESQGSLVFPGETLVGGWCVVHRTGATDLRRVVGLSEYNKNQSLWKTMPATMIEKVAIGQAVRRAFPEDFLAFQGLAERIQVSVDEQVGEEEGHPISEGILPEKGDTHPQNEGVHDEQAALGFGQDGDRVVDAPQTLQEATAEGPAPAATLIPDFPTPGALWMALEQQGFKSQQVMNAIGDLGSHMTRGGTRRQYYDKALEKLKPANAR